jgi:hypothetical protein
MIDIFVQRGPGDKRGDDIVDSLIGSLPVAIARGRNELDERAQPMQTVTMETVYRDGVRLGQLARVLDSRAGVAWMGKIVGISHRGAGVERTTTLRIKRPVVTT